MARSWHTAADRPVVPGWWSRHWANPSFSGSLIGVLLVLLVLAGAAWLGIAALHG